MTVLKRALNEAPTVAVIVCTVLGLSESDAVVWKEAVASLSALGTWLLVRSQIDGPVQKVQRDRDVREALAKVRRNEFVTGGTNPFDFEAQDPEPLTDSDSEFRHDAIGCLVEQGYTAVVAKRSVDKFLLGEELTPQEANCITQVRQSGIRLPKVS